MTPKIPKDQLERMLEDTMELAGEEFDIIREENSQKVQGIRQKEEGTNRKYIQFHPDTDIKKGDTIVRKVSGDQWIVEEVDPRLITGNLFAINAYYKTEVDKEAETPQAVSYTISNSSNIIAGSQSEATINVNFSNVEHLIKENGNSDIEELLELIEEIKRIFENHENIEKGSLTKFSQTLEKHSWLTGSLVQLLGNSLIQYFFFQ